MDKDDPKGLRRAAIWSWAKSNGIDHGLPIEKIGDAINKQFFNGAAKPEWITDILSGRKTPYRQLSNAAWKAQYNRRQITLQAQDISKGQMTSPTVGKLQKIWNFPRTLAVAGHGAVFPVTHAGDLAFRPQSWGVFTRNLINTWAHSWSGARTERLMDSMRRDDLYDLALRSGVDIGERGHSTDLVNLKPGKGTQSERAYSILKIMRFELWKNEMNKYLKPDMPQEQALDYGKNFAEWANHATGSARGLLSEGKIGGKIPVSGLFFGPKLTESKIARIVADPLQTLGTAGKVIGHTFANWEDATPGEKAVALTRLSGATQYVLSGLGFLGVNAGLLWATNQKDKINFTDPTKSDWMAFKAGGLEWSLPGLHSELRNLGKLMGLVFADSKTVSKANRGETKHEVASKILGDYLQGKLGPVPGTLEETAFGQDYMGRALPWVHVEPAKTVKEREAQAKKPPYGWTEYALSHGPLPLQGPIRYFYDQFRQHGASAMDAASIIKAMIIAGVGATGVHMSVDYGAEKEAAKRQKVGQMLLNR